MKTLTSQLQSFTNGVRRALVAERASQLLALSLGAILALIALDFALRLPAVIRVAELALLCGWVASWVWWKLVPAIRFNPPLVEVALRLERNHAVGSGVVASGAEFEMSSARSPWAQETVQAAANAVPSLVLNRIDRSAARRAALGAVVAAAVCTGVAMLAPDAMAVGMQRLFTPFAGVQWPARTMVESGMLARVHPRGAALALRALAVRGDPATMRVTAEYRLLRNGSGDWKTVVLAPQPDGSFERLVETDGDAIEVAFQTSDMETDSVRVDLLRPPRVVDAQATILPPAYAEGDVDDRRVDLGPGTDRRAVLSPPVLEGSRVELAVTVADAEAPPTDPAERAAFAGKIARLSGAGGSVIVPDLEVDASNPDAWTLRWTSSGPGVLELSPEGREGIRPAARIAYEIPSVPDQAPSIAVTDPASDETVTENATPFVVVEGRDDLRVSKVWLQAVRAARKVDPEKPLVTVDGTPGPAVRVETTLTLKDYALQPGDSVVLTAYANDAFEQGGLARKPIASAPRILRIISVTELTEQVRSRLGQLREAAGRLREEQHGIREAAEQAAQATQRDGEAATQAQRAQLAGAEGRLVDRIGAFERAINELGGRLERNATDGAGLKESIDEAVRQARDAAKEAQDAAASLPQEGGAAAGAEHAAAAERALAELESALERDQASAQLARRIDELSERVAAAQAATRALEQRTVGQNAEDLAPADRTALEQAAQAQREAAGEARALAEQLQDAAAQAEGGAKPEPGAAEAMRQAAREAEERGLARQLEQAAEETQANRMQGAQEAQQRAQEALDAMRQAMRDQQRARNEDLRRRMASLVESLRSLLGGIGSQAMALQGARVDDAPQVDTIARGVLGLSRNAVSIAAEAVAAGSRTHRVAELVDRAGTQLDGSATDLRADLADLDSARAQLDLARRSVEDALSTAQAIERRAQQEGDSRRRAELRDLYTQVLDRQRSAKTSTEAVLPAPGQPPQRRTIVESKRIAAEQNSVTAQLQAIGSRADVSGSELFKSTQGELVAASRQAGADLSTGSPSRRTTLLQDQVVRTVAALAESLADPERADDPFAQQPEDGGQQGENQGGQGENQAGVQRMPPIAELKLLRTLAQQSLDDTRAAAGLPADDRGSFLERVSRRQKSLLDMGEKWMERMNRESQGGNGAPPADAPPVDAPPTNAPPAGAPPMGAQSTPAPPAAPPTTPPATPPATPPTAPPAGRKAPPAGEPSLDDALGLEGDKERSDDAENRRRELERSLRQEKPRDLLESALNDLRRSTNLLAEQEPGLPTQRLQESAIRKFDELITTARRIQQDQQQNAQQNQQQQQGQERNQQNQQQGQQAGQQGQPEPRGDKKGEGEGEQASRANGSAEAGMPDDSKVDPTDQMADLDESRISWGQLPPRVRDAVRQGLRDPMSAAYRKLTQDYYRRLAEEPRR